MSKETKILSFQVRALGIKTNDDEQEVGEIEAYGAVFNNVDDGNDRILPKAFDRTIKNSKSRATARNKKYLIPMLWQHKDDEQIGSWYDLEEDSFGLKCKGHILLATQRGREYYALAKAGMADQFSIIYEVMPGGAKYDKSGVRDLSELRLFTIDPVTLAMNEETLLVGIKSKEQNMEIKTVIGNTSGPIGPRDESWDGSAAEKWIWSKALDDDDEVKPAVAKKYFMRLDGDASLKGSYSYPFWIDDHISVGAVKAIAGAVSGARGADAGGDTAGLKKKVETLYNRVNKKYPDADPLEPPWKDDNGKSRTSAERKTLLEHYNEEMAEDLCEDWSDVYLCSLTQAILDAFTIGDQPEQDISEALDDFKELVLSKFVAQAIECDFSGWLEEHTYSSSSAEYLMQYGNDSRPNYGYMSRFGLPSRKEMLSGDATTGGFFAGTKADGANLGPIIVTKDLVGRLVKAADKAKKAIETHVEGLHNAADEVTTLVGGNDEKTPTEKRRALLLARMGRKAGRTFSSANTQALSDHADTLHDMADAHGKAMTRFTKTVQTVADDLADILQGSEPTFAGEPGTPDEGHQEGKHHSASYRDRTRTAPSRSSTVQDTVTEEDIATSLQRLKALRTTA